ncbi:MAG TPA: glycosyltransferase [Jiangellales bacterium]|nr:glycosyltransferase [Jiangellales bacterium]
MTHAASSWADSQVLQRLVLPVDRPAALALHGAAGVEVLDDRRLRVPRGGAELAGYADAFPAGAWRHATGLASVRLRAHLDGPAEVVALVSDGSGTAAEVARSQSEAGLVDLDVDLSRCADGGWAWFSVRPGSGPVVVGPVEWAAPGPVSQHPVVAAVTTFDRPGSCTALLRALARTEPDLLVRVVVVDQGTRRLDLHPDLDAARDALGERLVLVRQPNLGGSGGFARGMLESLDLPDAHVLLLDDDIEIEPETIRRLAAMADRCLAAPRLADPRLADGAGGPTVVGAQMLSSSEPTRLHTFGEVVDRRRFWWGPAPGTVPGTDLARHGLRGTPWLHRRAEVDFNGWWTCLVPRAVIDAVGLPLPVFIKWDDAEYGLRAAAAGVPTVTLPGAVMWHVPWSDKDDALDWKAYFLHRNRLTAALLHARGATVPGLLADSLAHQVKHVVSLQYAASALRQRALSDVLSGPGWLRPGSVGPDVPRGIRAAQPDGRPVTDRTLLPPAAEPATARTAHRPGAGSDAPGRVALLRRAVGGLLHQLRPVPAAARVRPDADLTADEARWWRLAGSDSVVVAAASGAGWTWHVRDRGTAARTVGRAVRDHLALALRWRSLTTAYRASVEGAVRPDTWRRELPGGPPPSDPPAGHAPVADTSPRWR